MRAEQTLQLNDLDVLAEAGFANALVKTFSVPVYDGYLNLRFGSVVEDPMVAAVEVVSVGASPTTTTTAPPTTTTTAPPTTTATAPPTTTTTAPPTTTTTTPSPSPSPTGDRPTRDNTGPVTEPTTSMSAAQFSSSRTCNGQRVTGNVLLYSNDVRGTTWTINNCVFDGQLIVTPEVGASGSNRSTWNITGSEFRGGFSFNNPVNARIDRSTFLNSLQISPVNASGNLDWVNTWDFPVTVTNSFVYAAQGPCDGDLASCGHTTALAGWGRPRGVTFTNTAFVQAGPFNGTATATINYHGADTVFDGCWFHWENGTAAWYTVYLTGPNNLIRNSRFERGRGSYVYPASEPPATYIGNTDIFSGELAGL